VLVLLKWIDTLTIEKKMYALLNRIGAPGAFLYLIFFCTRFVGGILQMYGYSLFSARGCFLLGSSWLGHSAAFLFHSVFHATSFHRRAVLFLLPQ
jgi:hypothetical protein